MDDSLGMGGIERIRQLDTPVEQAIEGQTAAAQAAIQRVALQQFHGDKHLALVLVVVGVSNALSNLDPLDRINRADVGVVQGRRGTSLEQKTVQRILIAGELWRQELQRNPASQIEVFCFVDNPHPAAPQLAGNAVMRDGLADHKFVRSKLRVGKFILGGIRRAVKRQSATDRAPKTYHLRSVTVT